MRHEKAKHQITGSGYIVDLDGTIATADGLPRRVTLAHTKLAERRATIAGKKVGWRKTTQDECSRLWKS